MSLKFKSKPIPVKVDQRLLDRITEISERMGEAKSTVMRMAMRLGLDTLEAALEIQPSILRAVAAESRDVNEPQPEKKSSRTSYPPHQPQGVAMNEPRKKRAAS